MKCMYEALIKLNYVLNDSSMCTFACFSLQLLQGVSIRVIDDGFHHDRKVN